jgi:hypothetical protein
VAWIRTVPEGEAEGRRKELYHELQELGRVDNILKIHVLNVPTLEAHFQLHAKLIREHPSSAGSTAR